MKQAVEIVKGLKYKLGMFGVPRAGIEYNGKLQQPANIYCDNKAVYKNVSIPTSVLNKKMHGIPFLQRGGCLRYLQDSKGGYSDQFGRFIYKSNGENQTGYFDGQIYVLGNNNWAA